MGQFADDVINLRKQIQTQQKNRKQMTQNLRQEWSQKRQSVANTINEFHKNRMGNRQELSKRLKESRRTIGKTVGNIKNNVAIHQKNFRKQLQENSIQARTKRQEYLTNLQSNVNKSLSTFKNKHMKEADRLRKNRLAFRKSHAEYIKALKTDVSKRKQTVSKMRKESNQQRKMNQKELNDLARDGRSDRALYLSSLKKDV
ncbi:MAG: hypothetical protein OMM_10221, partial [Candidatus Magnetoglobus multicellularis str. Araruama]